MLAMAGQRTMRDSPLCQPDLAIVFNYSEEHINLRVVVEIFVVMIN